MHTKILVASIDPANLAEQRDGNTKRRFSQGNRTMLYPQVQDPKWLRTERRPRLALACPRDVSRGTTLRAQLHELAAFVSWFAIIASCTAQYPMVWVAFWDQVQTLRERVYSSRREVASPVFLALWVTALGRYRRAIYQRVPPDVVTLVVHAEVFACTVLAMTGGRTTRRRALPRREP